ncbi:hypothetical protein ACIBG7_43105 [Nonomuraea sp. NPDC050328]|uniref:Lsr2 family DNA-binding protein n=1 Tax=Nonomuraea sp. NPDC050328 TaxID=3364361 RepID=UPI00378A4495
MTTAITTNDRTPMHPDMSRALAMLATGHAISRTAEEVGWPLGSVRALINGQKGWLLSDDGRVVCPGSRTVTVPAGVDPSHLEWAKGLPRTASPPSPPSPPPARKTTRHAPSGPAEQAAPRLPEPEPPLPQPAEPAEPAEPAAPAAPAEPIEHNGPADRLLELAAGIDNKRVQGALRAARTALDTLHDCVTAYKERLAQDAEVERARQAVLDEIAALEAKLTEAKQRARALRAKPAKATPQQPPPGSEAGQGGSKTGRQPTATPARKYAPDADYEPARVRAWAREQGYTVPARGRFLPGPVVQEWLDAQADRAGAS